VKGDAKAREYWPERCSRGEGTSDLFDSEQELGGLYSR